MALQGKLAGTQQKQIKLLRPHFRIPRVSEVQPNGLIDRLVRLP